MNRTSGSVRAKKVNHLSVVVRAITCGTKRSTQRVGGAFDFYAGIRAMFKEKFDDLDVTVDDSGM